MFIFIFLTVSTTLLLVCSVFAEAAVTGATRDEGAAGAVLVEAGTGNSRTSRCEQLEEFLVGLA